MTKKLQKGFTLIELMIVVAIIGILAAVAIPQYQDYTLKAKLSKAVGVAAPLKTAVAMYYQTNGGYPTTWTSAGLSAAPTTTTEVSAIGATLTNGAIVLTLANIGTGIDAGTVTITPTAGTSAMTWANTCSGVTSTVAKTYIGCP